MNTTKRHVAIAIATCGLLAAAAGCAGSTVTKTVSAPTSAAAASSPAAAAAPPSPSPSSSALTGPVGTGFTVTGPNGPSGATTSYTVTLNQMEQHAMLGQDDSLSNGNDHVAAAQFTISGMTGQTSDDANSDAVAVGTDSQDYQPSFDTITAGTNFNGGDFNVGPGTHVNGWVTFELPAGVSVASIQWSPGGGSGQTATWTV